MRNWLILFGFLLAGFPLPADEPVRPRAGDLKVGDPAPAFKLNQLGTEKAVKLSDLKGKPVVLVFGSCT